MKSAMAMFAEIGTLRHLSPSATEVQEKITPLQKFITDNYYVCTDEILKGLGQMYDLDLTERITGAGKGKYRFIGGLYLSASKSIALIG